MIGNLKIAWHPDYAWRCYLGSNLMLNVEEGKQPNAFHRLMQRLCFGFRWERIKEKKT